MARGKDAEERKKEILDAAERLFVQKGFDNTSTNDILAEVGIARGTLYYHFASKEEILDGVIARMTDGLLAGAKQITKDESIPILERLTKAMISLNVQSPIGLEIMNQVHKPQNALLHQKMQERMLRGVVPILTELEEEGIRQGLFHTDYPVQAAELLMLYSNEAFDALAEQTEEERQLRIRAFIYHAERVLGAREGVLQEAIFGIFRKIEGIQTPPSRP